MIHFLKSMKVNVSGSSVLLIVVLLLGLCIAILLISQTWLNLDKGWTFDSSIEYEDSVEHPDFKLNYPITWENSAYHGERRGIKDVWAEFGGGFSQGFRIYWRQMTNPSLEEIDTWGQEIINRREGFDISELQEIDIGDEDYPAWVRTFQADRKHIIVYVLDDNGAYIFLFSAASYNAKAEETFQHILDSFQIIETEN